MTDPLVRSLPRTRRHEVAGASFAFFDATTPHRFVTDLSGDRHSLLAALAAVVFRVGRRRIDRFPQTGDENHGLTAQVSCAVPFNLFFPHS